MRSTLSLVSAALLLSSSAVNAIYFTNPTSDTVWDVAAGQTLAWKFQSGDARLATLLLENSAGTNITILTDVALKNQETTFPDGISFASANNAYTLMLVNSDDLSYVYTQVGPIPISSLTSSKAATSTTTTKVTSTAPAKTKTSTVTPSTTSTPLTTTSTSTVTVIPTTSTTPTTTSSSSSSSSSITTSDSPLAPETVTSTAAVVTITSSQTPTDDGVATVVVTATASQSSATIILSRASASAKTSAGHTLCARWFSVASIVLVVGWQML
ncbi:hypothetical protein T439DRAFT_322920 [Meredithblackwellia eburnea MCA 4105]